ncbi:MAG: hypothetical protein AAF270_09960 [Pseudomonadota bacterium]
MWVASGVALQALGIVSLRSAKQSSRARLWRVLGGVGALSLSIAAIAQGLGFELGLTWALVTVSLVAYALILTPAINITEVGHQRVPKRTRRMPAAPSGSKLRLAVRLFSAGPLYLICALSLSLLIATKPWAQEITRLFTGGLMTPVFWSIGALHATVDTRLLRVIYLPIAIAAIAGLVYWFL